jgi:hypothetical protein
MRKRYREIVEIEGWGVGCIGRGREREGMEEEERLGNGIKERGKNG